MTLSEFDKELQRLMNEAKDEYAAARKKAGLKEIDLVCIRPFTCDGNPLDCNVIITGLNPGTDTKVRFSDCWMPDSVGFDLKNFRAAMGKVTPTTKKIDDIILCVPNAKFLVTNLSPWPGETEKKTDRTTKRLKTGQAFLSFLLRAIPHGVVVAHHRYYLTKRKVSNLVPPDALRYNHFSPQGGEKSAEEIAQDINEALRRRAV